MIKEHFIAVSQLCNHHTIELSFLIELNEIGLIEIETIDESHYIHQDKVADLEKMIRLHLDLNLNIEGIDVVLNLLNKVEDLQIEVNALQNRLRLYEEF
jgi:DNA-binding transcriptional MerR regulator